MSVKEKLKNGKDRVVEFVDDHKIGLAVGFTWAVTTALMWIGDSYNCKNAYKRGALWGLRAGCTDGINRALSCISDHTDLTNDEINDAMLEYAGDYGLRQKGTE